MRDEMAGVRDAARMQPRALLSPSWDVKVRWWSSLLFTVGMLILGLGLGALAGPVLWLRDRWRAHRDPVR